MILHLSAYEPGVIPSMYVRTASFSGFDSLPLFWSALCFLVHVVMVQSPGCAAASTWRRRLLMQTSCAGFCAGGAVGFVVFGAVLDAGC